MKLLSVFLLSSFALLAQTATQGNITRTLSGDAAHTVVSVSSTTPGELIFKVALHYQATLGGLPSNAVKLVVRSAADTAPLMAIFDVPLAHVLTVSITEYSAGESQVFDSPQPAERR